MKAMISWARVFLVCVVIAYSQAETLEITLKSGEEKRLNPKTEEGTVETTWNLNTCEECKFVLFCFLYSKSCDDHLLTIYDGNTTFKECGPRFSGSVHKNSIRNKMTITIMTKGPIQGSFCHVRATKPYITNEYKEIDSSEHGLGTGSTRNTSCKCGWANKNPGRIVGGEETSPNEYPFVAILKIKNEDSSLCGASIISAYHILTAAHCTYYYSNLKVSVIVGAHDKNKINESPFTKEIDVKQFIHHPNYDERHSLNDIAILLLEEKIEFNDAVGPVCLPSNSQSLIGEYIKVMGWGRLSYNGQSSDVLRQVNLKVIDLDICGSIYQNVDLKNPYQLCTYAPNRDSCQGDSGGPLVWRDPETNRFTQVALVSYGRMCGSTDPAVNTQISFYMDWIRKVISDTLPQDICI